MSGLGISGVAACFCGTNVHSNDFALFQPLKSQHSPSMLVIGLLCSLYSNLFPPFYPFHPPTQREHSWYHLAYPTSQIFYLIWWELPTSNNYVVLGKLSNTVKWLTFCAGFIGVLTILGWLWRLKIFKIDYHVTSNARFGTFFLNPVTITHAPNYQV